MRCRECGYRLWNLPSRTCPECGTGFWPSEFEFVPNSVQFRCPQCRAAYYGTSEKGHLEPVEFNCAGCGNAVHMDQMILLPTSGIEEEQTKVDQVPWLEREKRGFFRAWFATIGMALVQPGRLMRAVPESQHAVSAFWFAILTNPPCILMGLGLFVILPMVLTISAGTGGGGVGVMFGLVLPLAFMIVCAIVLTGLMIALWGMITHGLLRITGPTHAPIRQTYNAIGFSAGANAITAIPCIGFYVGWIWWVVSAVIMVKVGQRVSGLRAAFSVLTLPACVLTIVVSLYGWLMYSAFTGGWSSYDAEMKTNLVSGAILGYATDHNNQVPNHAFELIAGGYLQDEDLVLSNVDSQSVQLTPGTNVVTTTTPTVSVMPKGDPGDVVRTAISSMADGSVTHRAGDFVFIHNGVDLSNCDGTLWMLIQSPDPDRTPDLGSANSICIGFCDGMVETVDATDFPDLLKKQNELRSSIGLAPIPDPETLQSGP